jgi:hypothetical protein
MVNRSSSSSLRDPQEDKSIHNDISLLSKLDDVRGWWEGIWAKKAQELFTILDEKFVVSKNQNTKETLTELRDTLSAWIERLEKEQVDSNAFGVLQKDIALIDERIVLLDKLWNPQEQFSLDAEGRFDLRTLYRTDIPWADLEGVRVDPSSFRKWTAQLHVEELPEKNGVTFRTPKWLVEVKLSGSDLVVDPIDYLDEQYSFSVIWNYHAEWTKHWLALKRKFVVQGTEKIEQSSEALKEKLMDEYYTPYEEVEQPSHLSEEELNTFLRDNWISKDDYDLLSPEEKKHLEEAILKITVSNSKKSDTEFVLAGIKVLVEERKQQAKDAVHENHPQKSNTQKGKFVYDLVDENNEIKATLSDVEALYRERAEHEAEEQLRKEYEAMPRGSLFSLQTRQPSQVWNRFKTYYRRESRKEKLIKQSMRTYKQEKPEMRNSEMIAAADRHEREAALWNEESNIEKTLEGFHDERVDALCREYVLWGEMSDADFEDKFQKIVTRQKAVKNAFDGDFGYAAGNILLKLRERKAYFAMLNEFTKLNASYTISRNSIQYRTRARAIADTYIKESHKSLNANIKNLLDAPVDQKEVQQWLNHERKKIAIESNTMKIKLDVLLHGKGAYAINNTDREKNPLAKFGALMDKWPKTSIVLGIGWTIALAASWMWLWATAIPVLKIAAKKAAHHTKEQKGEEKKLVRGLDAEKARLRNLQDIMDDPDLPWRSVSKYRARRQYNLYAKTTQVQQMHDIRPLIKKLEDALVTWKDLEEAVVESLVRVDQYHKQGHNFLAQQDAKALELTMNTLQALTVSGSESLGQSFDELRQTPSYQDLTDDLVWWYEETRTSFKKQRALLAGKYALSYAGAAIWLQWLLKTGAFENLGEVQQKRVCDCLPSTELNDQIVGWFKLTDAEKVQLEQWFWWNGTTGTTLYHEDAFWTALHDIKIANGMSEAEFGALKNNFMESLAWDMQENGQLEILHHAKTMAISPNDAAYQSAETFLVSHGIRGSGDGQVVLDHIAAIKADPTYLDTLSPERKWKTAEYCYFFLAKWASASHATWGLLDASFHTAMMENCERVKKVVEGDPTLIDYLKRVWSAVGVGVFANTFIENVKAPKKKQSTWSKSKVYPLSEEQRDYVATNPYKTAISGSMREFLQNS